MTERENEKIFEKMFEALKKFAWRGFSAINFCPGCMKSLLTSDEAIKLVQAFSKSDHEAFNDIIGGRAAGFAFYIPRNEEMALLLEHRVIIHPFCSECGKYFGEEWMEDRVEQNIVLSRRYIPHPKIKLKEEKE